MQLFIQARIKLHHTNKGGIMLINICDKPYNGQSMPKCTFNHYAFYVYVL